VYYGGGKRNRCGGDDVDREIIKPKALHPGDTIGVVAPAAAIEREYLERGVAALSAMGYRVKVSRHALDRATILAGEDRVRASEVAAFFADPEVKAIFAARGGYGCGRILPLIDFDALRANPKIFMGFSDETFLLNALVDRCGLVSFHGPMVAMDFAGGVDGAARAHLTSLLAGGSAGFELPAPCVVRKGKTRGPLIGGCLSVVVAMLGTPWEPKFDGRILFLEDTGEKAYRVDRMLTQLRQCGVFKRVAGIVFGAIHPVNGSEAERSLIAEFIACETADLNIPVLSGIEAGHGTDNYVLPFGLEAELDAATKRLIFTESAVMP